MDLRWMGSKKRGDFVEGRIQENLPIPVTKNFETKDFRPEFQETKITLQAQLTALKNPYGYFLCTNQQSLRHALAKILYFVKII
jgi:hypothetical protein